MDRLIAVAGDVTRDHYMCPIDAASQSAQRRSAGWADAVLPGGAWLLTELLRERANGERVVGPRVGEPAAADLAVLASRSRLARVGPGDRYVIADPLGFLEPPGAQLDVVTELDGVEAERCEPDTAVFIHLGLGFADKGEALWRQLLRTRPRVVISSYLTPSPPAGRWWEDPLWRELVRHHGERLVAVIPAEAVRGMQGVSLSRGLSWERTATELLFERIRCPSLAPLLGCRQVVVTFGTDGAVVMSEGSAWLVLDTAREEGGFVSQLGPAGDRHALVWGLESAITAAIALEASGGDLVGAVRSGLCCARQLASSGLVWDQETRRLSRASVRDRRVRPRGDAFTVVEIPLPCIDSRLADAWIRMDRPDPAGWRILEQETAGRVRYAAAYLVTDGHCRLLDPVPRRRFGGLETFDRREIEAFSAMVGVLREHQDNPAPDRPLCLAIFGPPGCGKSYAAKQIKEAVDRDGSMEMVTFNLAQKAGAEDLVAAFHRVRDVHLRGRVPFVFLDEFDSALDGEPLGWLKLLLAPMHDGVFRDRNGTHPLGSRAVLVFAGGTAHRWQDFVRDDVAFREAKGPDFASRLRGHVDILGPNPVGLDDGAFPLRRAVLLRALLEARGDSAGLFEPSGGGGGPASLCIDPGVLRAFLFTHRYHHGARSISAVLDMSRLAGHERFERAALPPVDQLRLHVDAEEFLWLVASERYASLLDWSDLVDASSRLVRQILDEGQLGPVTADPELVSLAERAHTALARELVGQQGSLFRLEALLVHAAARLANVAYHRRMGSALVPWPELHPDQRLSNLDSAALVPERLARMGRGCRVVPRGGVPDDSWPGTDSRLVESARAEHQRWCRERRFQGWRYHPERLPARRQHPDLVPWESLPSVRRQLYVDAFRDVGWVLAGLGLTVGRGCPRAEDGGC